MADLTLPEYYKGLLINATELEKRTAEQFLTGYLIVNGDLEFPEKLNIHRYLVILIRSRLFTP